MTGEQFQRWKDFALRMARACYPGTMRNPSRKWIIARVEEFIDDMEEYHPRISDWDSCWSNSAPRDYPCVSVRMLEYEWEWMPNSIKRLEDAENLEPFETARERWFGPVCCCVRAGLDMASEPSAGVVGFTLGDLRKMYPEGIPEWVASALRDDRDKPLTTSRLARFKDSEPVWL